MTLTQAHLDAVRELVAIYRVHQRIGTKCPLCVCHNVLDGKKGCAQCPYVILFGPAIKTKLSKLPKCYRVGPHSKSSVFMCDRDTMTEQTERADWLESEVIPLIEERMEES